jgi:aminoglycoside 6'-N-acetyltransferase Ib
MQFEFRPITKADVAMLFEWHQRPHVLEWWDGYTSLDALETDTFDWDVHPFIAYRDGQPFAYIQWYVTDEAGVVGIDQFIASADSIGRGLGTALVSQFVEFLFADPAIETVIVDPLPHNARAIRCYEKAAFRFVEMKDGAYLMRVDRTSWEVRMLER